ncbi:hypothetical protein ACFYMB_18715 [Micromonospora haikouensis]|uniref:hypothetical protein n=1 Tax=Micromonospora haikouensis TaxID=686309 RepID=UPI003680BB3B
MSPSDHPFHLWIARDAQVTAVALTEMRMSGRANVREWGSITEVTPGKQITGSAASKRVTIQLIVVAVVSLYVCGLASAVYWWLLLAVDLALVLLAVAAGFKAARRSTVVAPDIDLYPSIHRLLTTHEERLSFRDLQALAERIGRTLPALDGLVDPSDAAELVAESLWEGAAVLARRQEIREVRDELVRHASDGTVETNRARLDLQSQQQRAGDLWEEVNADLARLTSHLMATAAAGERFVRDQDLDDTLQRTGAALDKLSLDGSHAGAYAGEQLAEETTAVLTAYRELNDLYGGKS